MNNWTDTAKRIVLGAVFAASCLAEVQPVTLQVDVNNTIDRALVHPMSNLIATEQVRGGDLIKVEFDPSTNQMTFAKEAEDMPAYAMAEMIESLVHPTVSSASACTAHEIPRGRRARAVDGKGNLAA
jgi:hypothetical protein